MIQLAKLEAADTVIRKDLFAKIHCCLCRLHNNVLCHTVPEISFSSPGNRKCFKDSLVQGRYAGLYFYLLPKHFSAEYPERWDGFLLQKFYKCKKKIMVCSAFQIDFDPCSWIKCDQTSSVLENSESSDLFMWEVFFHFYALTIIKLQGTIISWSKS